MPQPSNDLERQLNELSLKSLNLTSYVARPGFGTQGKPISVLANVSLLLCATWLQYRVHYRGYSGSGALCPWAEQPSSDREIQHEKLC